jgi:cytidylate kinase
MDRHHIGQTGYLHYLRQVILALGQQGHVVILGRGARYILPPSGGLILRLVATTENRVQRIAAKYGLDAAAARGQVVASDRQRANFIHHNFHGMVDDVDQHDMVINTTHFTPEATTNVVLAALREKLGAMPKLAAEVRESVAAA